MTARILVVCTANICRSPLAERLLQAYLDRYAPEADVEVSSAGTHARPGHAAARGMRAVAAKWGVQLEDHVSQRVDPDLVREADLVITMEDAHRTVVSRLAPGIGERTFTITELEAIISGGPPVDPSAGLAEHVAAWNGARARMTLVAPDVTDPYGGPEEGYTTCAWELAELVQRLGSPLAQVLQPSAGADGDPTGRPGQSGAQ